MLRLTGARTVSAGRVGALAGLVEGRDLVIVLDGSLGSGRRRTLGRVPQLQVAQDLLDDRGIADQTVVLTNTEASLSVREEADVGDYP